MGTELAVTAAVTQIKEGVSISLSELLEMVAPPPVAPAPASAPVPAVLTKDQKTAIDRFASVYGEVNPSEARLLSQAEVDALVDERTVLDTVAKAAEVRKAQIRSIAFSHFDAEIRANRPGGGADLEVDDRGFFLTDAEVASPATGYRLTREIRKGAVSLSPAALEALASDPEVDWFTRDDYLAMTRPVRVIDDAAVAIHMRRRPEAVVRALAQVATRGQKVASCNQRKIK